MLLLRLFPEIDDGGTYGYGDTSMMLPRVVDGNPDAAAVAGR